MQVLATDGRNLPIPHPTQPAVNERRRYLPYKIKSVTDTRQNVSLTACRGPQRDSPRRRSNPDGVTLHESTESRLSVLRRPALTGNTLAVECDHKMRVREAARRGLSCR